MLEPKIIYASKDFLVVNKPAGLLVHGSGIGHWVSGIGKTGKRKSKFPIPDTPYPTPEPTLVDWLLKKYPQVAKVGDDPAQRPGIVHRLDKETSGVMLVALNQKSFEYLKSLFIAHQIVKKYRAVIYGVPKKSEGIINAPIGIRNGTLKRSVRSSKMAKEAITVYRVLKTWIALGADGKDQKFSLVELTPKTGRTHQLRVHMMSIGNPIVGDPLYGPKKRPPWAKRLMLHALAIAFVDPKGKSVQFETEDLF